MQRLSFLIVALISAIIVSCTDKQEETYTIKGQVSDSLAGVPGVKVLLLKDSGGADTASLDNGKFVFTGMADKMVQGAVFVSTPENPMPDYETESIMPSFFVPVVLEEGETEVFIGDNVSIKKGELSSRFYALQKELLYEQIVADGLAGVETDPAKIEQIYKDMTEKIPFICKKYYEGNSDNTVGALAFHMMLQWLSADELKKYWDMASDKMRMELKDEVSMLLAEKGLELDENNQMVEKASGNTAVGQKFTDFDVKTVETQESGRLSDYVGKGNYVLVDFWAFWCGPCIGEMPNLANIYKKYKGKNFNLVSISVDDSLEETKAAIKNNNMTWTQLMSDAQAIDEDYGISFIPYMILFGPDGTILEKNLRKEEIGKALEKYIK